jgi:Putative restriction endonuclease
MFTLEGDHAQDPRPYWVEIRTVIAMTMITVHPAILRRHFELSEPAYELWKNGRLHDELGIPDDRRTRIEIIGGEIVVSPGSHTLGHAHVLSEIQSAIFLSGLPEQDRSWRGVQLIDFSLPRSGDGYAVDLTVLRKEEFYAAAARGARSLKVGDVGMVVEVTSEATAADDREPDPQRVRPTKWNGYAREGVGFYLLVDRVPDKALVTLYTDPHPARGVFLAQQSWKFGETVVLPEPFGVEIPTERWLPWGT